MAPPTWRLERRRARLESAWLAGRVDSTRPDRGLFDVVPAPGSLDEAQLLGLAMPSLDPHQAAAPVEFLARGAELLVAYEASEGWPVRVDAAWRVVTPSAGDEVRVAIELLLSVRTDAPDSRPKMAVHSVLAADQVLRAVDPDCGRFDPWTPQSGSSSGTSSSDSFACIVFRLPQGGFSYAQMVHRGDRRQDELMVTDDTSSVSVRHWLFDGSLEKGVILRARVRGLFLPRDRDLQLAQKCFADFASAEPPLGT